MSLQLEASEAICSALYQMPFAEFLGEQDVAEYQALNADDAAGGAHVLYFHLGEKPLDMRVSVVVPKRADEVLVKCEWRNYWADARNPLKGEQTFRISTYAASQSMLAPATETTLVRVLELFKQVLNEEGVAGKISDLQEDEDPPAEDGDEE